MASAFAHAFVAVSLAGAVTPGRWLPRVLVVAVVCSLLPDVDVLGFRFDISYGEFLGHRGLSHSIAFAALTAALVTPVLFRRAAWRSLRVRIGLLLFAVTASHGLLDAMTDGGLGVAFFSPFDEGRYFLPVRPVEVSPIGVAAFFTARPLSVLWTELVWIALPCSVLAGMLWLGMRRVDGGGRPSETRER